MKKKIKICFANYGLAQASCLDKSVEEIQTYKDFDVDITIYTTVEVKHKHKLYDSTIGVNLPYMCREDIVEGLDYFDYFLYSENDHLITEDTLKAWQQYNDELDVPYCCGLYRYEEKEGERFFVDFNKSLGEMTVSRTEQGLVFNNVHQGCFMLNKKQLEHCITSGEFLQNTGRGPYGVLEQGASDPYNKCGLKKVYPHNKELFKRLGIHHLSSKYSKLPGFSDNTLILEDIFN
jgi:hypothetical protein